MNRLPSPKLLPWLARKLSFHQGATALSLCLVITLTGCQTRYESGLELLAQDRIYDAEKEARYGLKDDPKDARMHLILAQALIKQALQKPSSPDTDKIKAALPHAQQAFDFDAGQDKAFKAEAGRTLGKIQWELGRPNEAVLAWRSAREAQPDSVGDADYLYALRTALAQAVTFEQYKEALALRQELASLIETNPSVINPAKGFVDQSEADQVRAATSPDAFRETRHNYAMSLTSSKRYDEAITLYKELAQAYPKEAEFQDQLGKLSLLIGKEDEANAYFDRFCSPELSPDEATQQRRMHQVANFAQQQKARGIAIRFHEKSLALLKDNPNDSLTTLRRLIPLYLEIKEQDRAEALMRLYLETKKKSTGSLNANDYISVSSLAVYAAPELALSFLEEAIDKLPPNRGITERVTNYYAQNARNADVERTWQRYVERSDNSRDSLRDAARWASARRNYDLAEDFYLKIAQRQGSSQDWLELARIYAQLAKIEELKKTLEKYISLAGEDKRTLRMVADLYRDQSLFDDAEKLYLRNQKKDPKDRQAAEDLAYLYLQWGKVAKIHEPFKVWLQARGNQQNDIKHVGEFMRRQQRLDDALIYYQRAADKGDSDSLLNLANIYVRQNRDLELKRVLDEYIKGHSVRSSALARALNYYNQSALKDEAAKILEELVTLNPRNSSYIHQLTIIYLDQGRDREASELIQGYLAQSSNPMRDLASISRVIGRRQGEPMLRIYQPMLAAPNPDPELYQLVGDSFMMLHKAHTNHRSSHFPTAPFGRQPMLQLPQAPTSASAERFKRKAEQFYEKYFEQASFTDNTLANFAQKMSNEKLHSLAAKAYKRYLNTSKNPNMSKYLAYSKVLFALGENLEGEQMCKLYFEKTQGTRSSSHARDAAEVLMTHKRYEAAEPYLKLMLSDSRGDYARRAFERLAQVYQHTDRLDQLPVLIEDFIKISRRPAETRRTILTSLLNTGQWELAAEQLDQIAKTERDDLRFDVAQNYFRAGKADRAANIFLDWASNHTKPEDAWLRVALFYEMHAAHREAKDAYERAVSAAPTQWSPRVGRGRFSLLQGRLKDGLNDFERALGSAPQDQQESVRKTLVEVLSQTGQHQLAYKAAREALPLAVAHKEYFVNKIVAQELASGDPIRSERTLQELKRAGLGLESLTDILYRQGYNDAVIALIEEEIAVGDYATAGKVLFEMAHLFTQQGGIDRLMLTLQPLLDRAREDKTLEAQLGEYFVREGHHAQGALYLRAALDSGITLYRSLLAHTYLELGQDQEAAKLFQEELAELSEERRIELLKNIATRYRVAQKTKQLNAFLEHLAQDQRFVNAALPLLISQQAERGDLLGALSNAKQILNLKPDQDESLTLLAAEGLDPEQRLSIFIEAANAIARAGHMPEAIELLKQTPLPTRDDPSLLLMLIRLEAIAQDKTMTEDLERYLATLDQSMSAEQERIKLASLMFVTGHSAQAKALAQRALEHPDMAISTEGFNLLLQDAFVNQDNQAPRALVDQYLEHSTDKLNARTKAIETLQKLGMDELALELAQITAKHSPTEDNLKAWLRSAHYQNNAKDFKQAAARLWQISKDPISLANQLLNDEQHLPQTADKEAIKALINPQRVIYPASSRLVMDEAEIAFRSGDVVRMRTTLLNHLKAKNFDPGAVEELLLELLSQGLYSEIAKVIAPAVPADKLTTRAQFALGIALVWIGEPDKATSHLEAYASSGIDSTVAYSQLAKAFMSIGMPEQALPWLEKSIKLNVNQPTPYFLRALVHLNMGKADGVREDIARSIDQGLNQPHAQRQLLEAALKGKQYEIAQELSAALFHHPTSSQSPSDWFVRETLALWATPEHAARGVKFFEANYTDIILNKGSISLSLLTSLSNLYESAKMDKRAFDVYEQAMRQQLIEDPSDANVATLMNNLAYTYSTSNKNIDRGLQLILMAMAIERKPETPDERSSWEQTLRNSSFIDTLGWIYYRQGKLQAANAEIQRAIRSPARGGTKSERAESYKHLAEILDAQGKHDQASWLYTYTETLK